MSLEHLFKNEIRILNIGLEQFYQDLTEQNVKAVQLNWKPVEISKEIKDLIAFFEEE